MRIATVRAASCRSLTHTPPRVPRACVVSKWLQSRGFSVSPSWAQEAVPLRKHLKEESKRKRAESRGIDGLERSRRIIDPRLDKWELTVGIEVHAELNTARKLFSPALAEDEHGASNSRVALFDAAMPGTQPQFQAATLLPALRAAIALGCEVQRKSGWDRKHYFHWDQPNGYQITQYYHPFAKDGQLILTVDDGVPASDLNGAERLTVGIKQIQMEQDTAKTTVQNSIYQIDLNRAGHPLIEIITLPHIHSAQAAAAAVRKIQAILKSVDACVAGMELGGLRADVNVSVRERGTEGVGGAYSGVIGLGQRTEIKNLSTLRSVEDAITAEMHRQIDVLESGGVVDGETRGWTLGARETTRLRGKEGEVDYRYMPDADLPPLLIGQDLVDHLRQTLPDLPDQTFARLVQAYGLTLKDAKTLTALDDGERVEFLEEVVELIVQKPLDPTAIKGKVGKVVGDWVLHELGGYIGARGLGWHEIRLTPSELADIVSNLLQKQITMQSAKQLLSALLALPADASRAPVDQLIEQNSVRLRPLPDEEYEQLATQIMDENPRMVAAVLEKQQRGKVMWFVGQMLRRGEEGTIEAKRAKAVIEKLLGVGR